MLSRVRWCILALALSSCGRCTAEPAPVDANAPVDARDAADATIPRVAPAELVTYDCEGVEPTSAQPCDEARHPIDEIVELSEQLPEIAADHRPDLARYWARGRAALASAESVVPEALTPNERVLAQNAALHLALASAGSDAALASRAKALVKKLAFGAHPRAQPEALDAWLGPSPAWTDRTSSLSPLFHESIFYDTRVVRLVRTKTLRANFAQLVAIDEAGVPFVTGVVASIEMRRGFGRDAPACVVLASPSRVRCNKLGGLAAAPNASHFPQSHFLAHDGDAHVRCNACHTAEDAVMGFTLSPLAPEEASAVLATRREAVLKKLATEYGAIP